MNAKAIKVIRLLFIVIPIIGMVGCVKGPTPTIVLSSTPSPLPSPTATRPISTATISTEQLYKNLALLLQDENCILPCLMGIIPDASTTTDIHNTLLPFQVLTKFGSLPIDSDGGLSIEYPLDAITSAYIDIYYFPSTAKQGMPDHILLHTMVAIIGGAGDDPRIFADTEYHQLFQRYDLPTILSSFGRPTQVLVSVMPSTGAEPGVASFFDLRLAYPDKGFYLSYYSLAQELDNSYQACPSNSFITIWAEVPKPGMSNEDLIAKMDNWPGFDFALGFKPLERATNMTIDQFYQTFSKPTDRCIDTPKLTWPTH